MSTTQQQLSTLYQQVAQAFNTGRYDTAIRLCKQALEIDPDHLVFLYYLGSASLRYGNVERAVNTLRRCVEKAPDNIDSLVELANALQQHNEPEEALEFVEQALAINAQHPAACRTKSSILRLTGRAKEAMEYIEPIYKASPMRPAIVTEYADLCRRLDRQQDGAAALEKVLRTPTVKGPQRRTLQYRLATLMDELGRYDEAFELAKAANPPPPNPCVHDATPIVDGWNGAIEAGFPTASPEVAQDGPVPVFVVGMPRSGTTLLNTILSAHPSVGSVGESPLLFRVVRQAMGLGKVPDQAWIDEQARGVLAELRDAAPGATHVVDKLPANYLHLGPACSLFPNARIIHARRDARDVCLSCFFQQFNQQLAYSQDLTTCARQFVEHEKTMDYWRDTLDAPIYDVHYEQLVEDPEPIVRAALEHLGLAFDPACLSFHKTDAHVVTASWAQVKRPLYTSSVGKWRHYAHHLTPMFAELGRSDRAADPEPPHQELDTP